jgi:hypothetical protein
MTLRVDLRAAAVDLLTDYVESLTPQPKFQIYRARPRTVAAPSAFVDVVRETRVYQGVQLVQRTAQADVLILHGPRELGGGSFDSGDATDQADAFVDGFVAWVDANVHAIGSNTTIGAVSVEDDPTYVPDWIPINEQMSYYATRIVLEGYAASLTI